MEVVQCSNNTSTDLACLHNNKAWNNTVHYLPLSKCNKCSSSNNTNKCFSNNNNKNPAPITWEHSKCHLGVSPAHTVVNPALSLSQ